VEVKAGRIYHTRIGVRPVGTQTANPTDVDTRCRIQYCPVRDDIVTDPHITEACTAAPDIYGGRANLVEDVIRNVGIRDIPVIDDDRAQFARVLTAESDRVV